MDEQLQNLIAEVCQYENTTPQRQKALNRLLISIQQLPGIYQSSHQDYPEAFNRTLEWVSNNIDQFEMRSQRDPRSGSPSVQNSFVIWINGYLKWRIRDLYTPDNKYDKNRIYLSENNEYKSTDFLENLPDPKFSLSLLDIQIAEIQATKRQRHGEAIRQYIEQDPEGKLNNSHPKKYPECNCQLLAMRLLLEEPPQRISDIAREFNINNQTLYSYWKQKCLPLLQEISQMKS